MSVPRVLVVEDDEDLREALFIALQSRGFEPFESGNAERAREIIRRAPPEAMLIDGLLPDGSGSNLIEFARERGFAGPIVMMSVFEGFGRESTSLIDAFVDKKINSPIDIATALARAYEKSKRGELER